MPYIKTGNRIKWHPALRRIEKILEKVPADEIEGEMNYLITSIVHHFDRGDVRGVKGLTRCYRHYNRAIGVLECVKLELYRRHIAPYEDEKRKQNGDVGRE